MIQTISYEEMPFELFRDSYHDVIIQSHLERKTPDARYFKGPQSYAVYQPDTGFCLYNPSFESLEDWAQLLYQEKIPLLAGEDKLHFKLLQTIGDIVPLDAELQVFCRYEKQDFCYHDQPLKTEASQFKISQATLQDVDKLFYFYRQSKEMEPRSKGSLEKTIKQDKLVFIQKLGKISSAALTHCETQTAGLIGGVYTPPRFRGKGYSYACMLELMRLLKAENKIPCLFYEQNNQPAKKLYQKLGFTPFGEWVIVELIYEPKKA